MDIPQPPKAACSVYYSYLKVFQNLNLAFFFMSASDLVNSLVPFLYQLALSLKNKSRSPIYLVFYRLNNCTSFKLFDLLWSVLNKLRDRKGESEQRQISVPGVGGLEYVWVQREYCLGSLLSSWGGLPIIKCGWSGLSWLASPCILCPSHLLSREIRSLNFFFL